jgi:DNA repair exonuclease SbcCD ATPase subunit
MKRIQLVHLTLQGFKSYRKTTHIDFPDGGFNFLGGANEVDPKLGSNGAGKSTLWEALCWCLYGTGIKGAKASDLASWGFKRPYAATELRVDGVAVEIIREGNPDRLTLAGEPCTQAQLDAYLGLTKARFTQSVLFGQGAKLFMDMSAADRGELLDEVLDLQLWQSLADAAGKKAKSLGLVEQQALRDIAHVSGQLEGLSDIEELQAQDAQWLAAKTEELEALLQQMDADDLAKQTKQQQLIKTWASPPTDLLAQIAACEEEVHKAKLLQQTSVDKLDAALQLEKFYDEHSDCPTCHQAITPAFSKQERARLRQGIDRLNASEQELAKTIQEGEALLRNLRQQQRELEQGAYDAKAANRALQAEIDALDRGMARALAQAEALEREMESPPFAAQIATLSATKARLEAELAGLNLHCNATQASYRHMDYWRSGFKKVRLFLIRQALDMLQLETIAAAAVLGLVGWDVKFVTETETKSGTIKSGVQVLVGSPDAPSGRVLTSGGEEQRVKLAVSLGFSNMIQRMAGIDWRMEVWDEPTNWLSAEGIDDLMECLRYRAQTTGKAVWIVDHRVLDSTIFDNRWLMRKTEQGSSLEVL